MLRIRRLAVASLCLCLLVLFGAMGARAVALAASPNTSTGVDLAMQYPATFGAGAADLAGARGAWALGFTGLGVTVAVVDTGISPHPDLGNRVAANYFNPLLAYSSGDGLGHGTHVAGIIAGDGRLSGGRYAGVAPGARLVNVKFTTDDGTGTEDALVRALAWVLSNHRRLGIRVVNVSSAVARVSPAHQSPVDGMIQALVREGVVVVAAAGNKGTAPCAVCHAPANSPAAITVGALDESGRSVAPFSGRGVTLDGFFKHEVLAPGTGVIAAGPVRDALRRRYPAATAEPGYLLLSGTSQAAPVVAGAVALMLEANPRLTPTLVKSIIWRAQDRQTGALDLGAAVALARTTQ